MAGRRPQHTEDDFFLVAFKICGRKDEHWINRLATWGTSLKGDDEKFFEGRVSHVEILFTKEEKGRDGITLKKWFRYSIMKSRGSRLPSGKIVWKPGVVHCIESDAKTMKSYRFYKIWQNDPEAYKNPRAGVAFLDSQVGQGFNMRGYLLNFILPFQFGVRTPEEAESKKINKWFCSELIVCAMQRCMKEETKLRVNACEQSPNMLYRIVHHHLGTPVLFEACCIYGDCKV
jgi:hypothetical protein